uniref:hypothetical protein n=1 Tax=Aerococcus urinaeequi TaxID=51665 RepID=UPI00352AA67A
MLNKDIVLVNQAFMELVDMPIKGAAKFKIYRIKMELEDKLDLVNQTLNGVTNVDERTEILEQPQELESELLNEEDLVNLELSMRQIKALQPVLSNL